ncbi:hypothetical protein V8G54_009987 [Vigna mungo]|uniref:Uncharacterized protein n=1 Tax=Vigna mungo TaxID=3915 RepID=A0AAQ3NX65_VIGMU
MKFASIYFSRYINIYKTCVNSVKPYELYIHNQMKYTRVTVSASSMKYSTCKIVRLWSKFYQLQQDQWQSYLQTMSLPILFYEDYLQSSQHSLSRLFHIRSTFLHVKCRIKLFRQRLNSCLLGS